uniref:Uncharacterized protein n=1 Tax=Globodera rostochiensis TaxID=31243 RepID=A0A914HUS7_GLORO
MKMSAKKLLKLRAFFGKTEPSRTVKLDVNVRYLDKANVQQNETVANFELGFFFYVKPIKNEYSADIEEENPLDKASYIDLNYNFKMKDIRTMYRMIGVNLYSPDLSKLYTVNLGQADPPGLFLNRRVFFETNNVSKTGIYYAFLCATARKHRRSGYSADKKYFLGYAPLLLNTNNNGIALSSDAAEHQRRTQNLTEFQLSIPVKLGPIFKHILWFLNLNIYHFDKVITNENDFGDMSKYCLEENWVEIVENDSNPASVGQPNLVLSQKITPLFDGSPNISFDLHANPMAELVGIASESANEFKRRSAQQAIKNIEKQMNLTEKNLKIIMKQLGNCSKHRRPTGQQFKWPNKR